MKHSKEALKDKKKAKKTKNNFQEQSNKLNIIIDNYDADVFRTFLLFVHCGSVVMDATNVTGKNNFTFQILSIRHLNKGESCCVIADSGLRLDL